MKSLFVWICLFLTGASGFAQAETPAGRELAKRKAAAYAATSVLTYDLYAGGIHAMDAKLTLKTSPSKYEAALMAQTQGMLKKLANWSGEFLSKGRISKGQTFPLSHQSASTWKNVTESKNFQYDGHGGFKSYKVMEGKINKTPKDIDLSLAKGTSDTLSSTLELMLSLPSTQACNGKELIFDGDRNYRLVFADTRIETLTKSDYNVYEGDAISCSVEVKPEKGKWRKKPRGWLSIQEQGRNKGSLPTIWFGKIESQKGAPALYVPVKIRIKTDYGTLFLHLTSVKSW